MMRRSGLWSIASLGLWLALWTLVSESGLVDTKFLPSPPALAREFWHLLKNGYAESPLWVHFVASFSRTAIGFSLAVVSAVTVGLLMGMSSVVYLLFNPIMSVLRPTPTIAFIPLMILWFGIGETSKILVIFTSAFLFIVLNTYNGFLQIPAAYKRVAENVGMSRRQTFFRVILPATAPSIMTGIKVGLAVSWSVVVAAELIAAQQGLGYVIMDAATFFRIPDVYIGVLLIGLVGFLLESSITAVERRVIHWRGR